MGQLNGTSIQEEATALAAQIWCQPEHQHQQMDVALAESFSQVLAGVMQERENWIDTARQNQGNADYWKSKAGPSLLRRLLGRNAR